MDAFSIISNGRMTPHSPSLPLPRVSLLFPALSLSLTRSFTRDFTCRLSFHSRFFSLLLFPSFTLSRPSLLASSSPFLLIPRARWSRERAGEGSSTSSSTTNFRTGIFAYSQRRTAVSLLALAADMSDHPKFASKKRRRTPGEYRSWVNANELATPRTCVHSVKYTRAHPSREAPLLNELILRGNFIRTVDTPYVRIEECSGCRDTFVSQRLK